jgi:Fe2+ or Zn2+ uptake regulation protein
MEPRRLTGAEMLEILRDRGYRATGSRRAILLAIDALQPEFTAGALVAAVQDIDAGIGRSTVFRMLDVLTHEGALDQISLPDGAQRYTRGVAGSTHHHHLICSSCGRTIPFEGCTVEDMIGDIARGAAFEVSGHQLEVFGRCADCSR